MGFFRLNETYRSFQGEGPNTGDRTLFVRFAGCNLKCPGWACDTQHAIDPKLYRKDMVVLEESASCIKLSSWIAERWQQSERICLTGGEVTLQPIDDLERALVRLKHHTGGAEVELFTNGMLPWTEGFVRHFSNIILDWKLPGSGEHFSDAWLKTRLQNLSRLRHRDALKFTLAGRHDFDVAMEFWLSHAPFLSQNGPKVYAGPVWGLVAPEQVAEWVLENHLPWSLNVQTHKYIWDPETRKV